MKSRLALVAVVALVGSLLLPAGATAVEIGDEAGEPNALATSTACVGPALVDAGFTDVSEDNVLRDAINCVAYHRIMIGKGNRMFGPHDSLTAFQALTLIRRAAQRIGAPPARLLIDGAPVLADDPELSDPVTRAEVAVLMARLLAATDSPGGVSVRLNASGIFDVYVRHSSVRTRNDGADWDWFGDARESLSAPDDSAVSLLYELGVVRGIGDGRFKPDANLTRAHMAALITRTLDHSKVRPPGHEIPGSFVPGPPTSAPQDPDDGTS